MTNLKPALPTSTKIHNGKKVLQAISFFKKKCNLERIKNVLDVMMILIIEHINMLR